MILWTQPFYLVQAVLLQLSVQLLGAALQLVTNGIGFSVRGMVLLRGLEYWNDMQDLNLSILLTACALVIIFLDLPTPSGSSKEKFMWLNWM